MESVRLGFVLDVAGYGRRTTRQKADAQRRVTEIVDEVLADLGLRLEQTHHHGTGDGLVVFLPGDVEVHRALTRLLRSAVEALAEDNQRYRDRLRLRMAVVFGPLGPAAIGFSGEAIVAASRLVDSDQLRAALAGRADADLVAMISDQLHGYLSGESRLALGPGDFEPVDIDVKEFHGRAWLWNGPASVRPRPETFTVAAGPAGCVIGIRPGRIERIHDIDIWVNSENTDMEMARVNDYSVSSIIRYRGSRRDAAGRLLDDVIADELTRAVGHHHSVVPGAAFVTGSGALFETNAVQRIIHVAAVQGEPGAGYRQVREVGACVANALWQAERLAAENVGIRTILFPMLGAGVGGASVPRTATELVEAAADYLSATPGTLLRGIYLLAYTEIERAALARALGDHPGLRAAAPVIDDPAVAVDQDRPVR